MSLVLADRVRQTTTATGTGTLALDGTVEGFQTFAVIGDNNTTYYTIAGGTQWEVGIGTYYAGTLARTTLISSSTGSTIDFAAGVKDVFVTYPAEKSVNQDATGVVNISSVSITSGTIVSTRINPRVTSAASASSLTPDISASDVYAYTALAAGLTINAPTGTPVDGDKLIFRLLDNGTSRALTWDTTPTGYIVIGVTLPTATTISKTTYVGCIYNANNTRWDVIAVTTQA